MHRCAANCCDQTDLSIDDVHSCVGRCSNELNKAQTYISNELTNFQVNNKIENSVYIFKFFSFIYHY